MPANSVKRRGEYRQCLSLKAFPVLMLGACSLWPSVPETVTVPPEAPGVWVTPLPAAGPVLEDWVDQFRSPLLKQWIDEAVSNNFDMAVALARFQASRQTAKASLGARLPTLEAQFAPGISGVESLLVPESIDAPLPAAPRNLVLNWEIDLWGRVSSQAKASAAEYVASTADMIGVRLSVMAGIVTGWTRLSAAAERSRLAERELQLRGQARDLTERRFDAGLATSLDVRLARSAEASAHARIAASKRELMESSRALEVMLGRYPAGDIKAESLPLTLPPMAELSGPMELLSRRPDIGAAEARLEVAGFQAKSVRAAMWPILNMRLNTTSISGWGNWAEMFDVKHLAVQLFLSITAPVFRGGALLARSRAAIAQAEAAAAGYAQTVINAWQEVENARSAEILLLREEIARARAVEESLQAESLAKQQYREGLISIFNLIDAQTRSISANEALILARTERILNRVSYHRALGGSQPFDRSRTVVGEENRKLLP